MESTPHRTNNILLVPRVLLYRHQDQLGSQDIVLCLCPMGERRRQDVGFWNRVSSDHNREFWAWSITEGVSMFEDAIALLINYGYLDLNGRSWHRRVRQFLLANMPYLHSRGGSVLSRVSPGFGFILTDNVVSEAFDRWSCQFCRFLGECLCSGLFHSNKVGSCAIAWILLWQQLV